MTFKHNIDDKTRFLVLYIDAEMKPTNISKTLGRPLRTIQDWVQKTDANQDIRVVQQGRGRKTTSTDNLKKNVMRRVRQTPEKSSTRKLGAKYGVPKTKVHEILIEKGLKYQSVQANKDLTDDQREDRVQYCSEMLENDGEKIYNTFFTDEMGMKLSDAHVKKAWGQPNKKIKIELPDDDTKVDCWGGISSNGATSLHIYTDNLKGSAYKEIVDEHIMELEELYPEGYYYQHDNHPCHKSAEGWMRDSEIEQIPFPSYSPDLTPIENLWFSLKHSVRCDGPRTEAELIRSLKRNWEILTTPEKLEPYFESLHSRYEECIEKDGIKLPY